MSKRIYWSSLEYNYSEKSSEYRKLKGGFVYAFIKASDAREALQKLEKQMVNEGLTLLDVEYVSPYDENLEWETDQETRHYIDLCREANNGSGVIFDDFHAYENE